MSNIIEFRLCDEDRARLDKIIEGLDGRAVAVTPAAPAETVAEAPRAEETAAPETAQPVEEVAPSVEPEPAAEPQTPQYTKADIMALVQKLAAPNSPKREQAKAIVKGYAAKVSDIPAEKYGEVMDKLTALDKEG